MPGDPQQKLFQSPNLLPWHQTSGTTGGLPYTHLPSPQDRVLTDINDRFYERPPLRSTHSKAADGLPPASFPCSFPRGPKPGLRTSKGPRENGGLAGGCLAQCLYQLCQSISVWFEGQVWTLRMGGRGGNWGPRSTGEAFVPA
jgi:hypothetical protein